MAFRSANPLLRHWGKAISQWTWGLLYGLGRSPNPAFWRGVALVCGAGNPDCAGDLSLLVGLDYINPSRREVAGWLLLSEFRTDFVQGFDSVH